MKRIYRFGMSIVDGYLRKVPSDSGAYVTYEDHVAEVARLQEMLADCYRASGADPDGDEDWRLAERAVDAVKELRENYDIAGDMAMGEDL